MNIHPITLEYESLRKKLETCCLHNGISTRNGRQPDVKCVLHNHFLNAFAQKVDFSCVCGKFFVSVIVLFCLPPVYYVHTNTWRKFLIKNFCYKFFQKKWLNLPKTWIIYKTFLFSRISFRCFILFRKFINIFIRVLKTSLNARSKFSFPLARRPYCNYWPSACVGKPGSMR